MLSKTDRERFQSTLAEIDDAGLRKPERILTSPQQPGIRVGGDQQLLNLCANNYLGLANHPDIIAAAKSALDQWGFGVASARFICGTQAIHKELESRLSAFVGSEDAILYTSCFDANGGLFETLLGPEDAIISDSLNHASIIDGVRLCKAQRFRYANRDMAELEFALLQATTAGARTKLIATDGVFSMDGHVAPLPEICDLAEKHGAMVMVDDSHSTGFFGPGGRGTHAFHGVENRVDIITSTLGKALGGASGGFTAASREIVETLRQRSRTYLFSNSVAPPIVAATLRAMELIDSSEGEDLRDRLISNTRLLRDRLKSLGLDVVPGEHPIVPIMVGNSVKAARMAEQLLADGIYVIAFSFPVVPKHQARIRVQVSAAHTREQLERAAEAFARVAQEA
ncbi:MAG: glycine C-acetyltransferase [Verrucomicrobiales bacterium]|jgi:glycine C-acetyltransferase